MHFQINYSTRRIPNDVLVYRPEEFSFDVEPVPSGCFTSVLLNDLDLDIDETGKVLSISGLCPHTKWVETKLIPPKSTIAEIIFVPDGPLLPGVCVSLDREYLPVHFDRASGWIRVQGGGKPSSPNSSIALMCGVVFEINKRGDLCTLWLKPHKGLETLELE
ncbi:MAG: hypothetical protein O2967_23365 [Proteobacteria bacterium]|nr:hypothetical protein [Pseudomonadota bacterium]